MRRRDEPARVPPAHARASGTTVVGLQVDDIERVVDELTAKHVAFERTTKPPLTTDERGIAAPGNGKAGWFEDPERTSSPSSSANA